MTASSWWREQYLSIAVGALVAAAVVAIGVGMFFHRGNDNALVMATAQDCLRIATPETCTSYVEKSTDVHARYAPRFPLVDMCENEFGSGGCMEVQLYGAASWAPRIAAIIIDRDATNDASSFVPVYVRPSRSRGKQEAQNTPVWFKGRTVGTLVSRRFGGAAISSMLDTDGNAVSNGWVRRLRGRGAN